MFFPLFYFFFAMKYEHLQQNISQSKSRIADEKLSVELYV